MPSSRFVTVADLHREQCSLLFWCVPCQRYKSKTPFEMLGGSWSMEDRIEEMEAVTIASYVARLKCKGCGRREIEWTVQARGPQFMTG